ncbi:GNAT family N-acetyltransferase [Oceanibacterium hippocampi]|uniref:N-acetyltransferase domain-containing protein n=1 Tax=Oceanibacterium hippocampi TaxID=745714 RepID=A0A1Y5SCZ1_9PROT|nr:N-acetyltransferase [Oceanibacterium hippocampi]SLN34775.1 hypothetical protein OCH7691_01362 [Oceanibacterium hippocampi]
MYTLLHERPDDSAQIETLLDRAFGPNRYSKTVYRLREGVAPLGGLSLVARSGMAPELGPLLGTIRYWPIRIGVDGPAPVAAAMLGPIAIEPERRGEGIGVALIQRSLTLARWFGHRIVMLVGDPEYYNRFGFVPARPYGLELPGPVEDRRFLVQPLFAGAMEGVTGMIGRPFDDADAPAIPAPIAAEAVESLTTARKARKARRPVN